MVVESINYAVVFLRVPIDKHLSWSILIENLTEKIASAIGALKRVRPFITTKTAVQVYKALILTTAAY